MISIASVFLFVLAFMVQNPTPTTIQDLQTIQSQVTQDIATLSDTTQGVSQETNQTTQASGVIINPVDIPQVSLGDPVWNGNSYVIPFSISAGQFATGLVRVNDLTIRADATPTSIGSWGFTFNPDNASGFKDYISYGEQGSGAANPIFNDTTTSHDFVWSATIYDGNGNVLSTTTGNYTIQNSIPQ